MNNEQRLNNLIEAFYKGTLTADEEKELDTWFHSISKDQQVYPDEESIVQSRMFVRLMEDSGYIAKLNRARSLRRWYTAVASIVLFMTAGLSYYYLSDKSDINVPDNRIVIDGNIDIKAGKNTAQLILEDGSIVDLDTSFGEIKVNENIEYADGSLVIGGQSQQQQLLASSAILKMKTPRAGQYRVKLSDGTVVWMNAATELTYPKEFAKDIREVKLDGEAYFEVAPNPDRPFIVNTERKSGAHEIKVLGTHFNVKAYPEQRNIETTLIEGSVRVSIANGTKSIVLKPGQMSVAGSGINVGYTDVNAAVGWKDGYFYFIDTDIHSVMNDLKRWYDIEVDYVGSPVTERFWARISKAKSLEKNLAALEATNEVKFLIKGRRVTVTK